MSMKIRGQTLLYVVVSKSHTNKENPTQINILFGGCLGENETKWRKTGEIGGKYLLKFGIFGEIRVGHNPTHPIQPSFLICLLYILSIKGDCIYGLKARGEVLISGGVKEPVLERD
jgi:hypothetical protein